MTYGRLGPKVCSAGVSSANPQMEYLQIAIFSGSQPSGPSVAP